MGSAESHPNLIVLGVFGLLLLLVHLILPLMRIGSVVGEGLLDLMRDWRGSRQMISGGAETMLISDVVHSDLVAVLIDVRVVALLANRLILLSRILHETLSRLFDSISGLVFKLIVSVFVHLLLRLQDRNVLYVLVMRVLVGNHASHQNDTHCDELVKREELVN